jgi:predicted O-linked N-acetylglucosamine transferase (SPINDLY family)
MSVSRNAPCPCGSGKKYKHCHGATPERTPERLPSLDRARDLHQSGYLPEAEMLYREILARSPRNADAMNLVGVLHAQRGDPTSALEWIGKAVAIDSRSAAYRFNFGKALLQLKRTSEACEALERATALDPAYAEAYSELALARAETGALGAAEGALRKVLALRPGYWEAHNNLGLLLHRMGKAEAAVLSLSRARELEPRSPEVLKNLGMALRAQGRTEEAVQAYRAALELSPGEPGLLNNLGNALGELSRNEEAIGCFRDALAAAPDDADVHYNWGLVQMRSGRLQEAAERFRAALQIDPHLAEAESALAGVLYSMGRAGEAAEACTRVLRLRPDDAETHSQLLFLLQHSADVTPRQIFDEHGKWAQRHAAGLSPEVVLHANPRDPERRLRVGYVSGDFRRHSVAHFFEPVLKAHDRDGFEIVCYYNLSHADETTNRLRRAADGWREILRMGDEEVASLIRADRIDILVDLSGHTKHNRLLVFARNPAPVQVTWLGYPATTGLRAVGYRVSDAIADPAGAEGVASEALLRLAPGFLCYGPPSDAPAVDTLPASAAGHVTFGSFNNLAKVGPDVMSLWQEILTAVPGSRLLIKAMSIVDPGTLASCKERLVSHGLPRERLDFAPGTRTLAEHLSAYNTVDIALDPFPYNGTTTTCEALWMGVPVVTLAGDRHAGRVGASLLTQIGMEEMIARTPDAYVAAAVALARDPTRLASLRAGMRDRIGASRLTDAATFARGLERAYRSVWRRWCENPETAIER